MAGLPPALLLDAAIAVGIRPVTTPQVQRFGLENVYISHSFVYIVAHMGAYVNYKIVTELITEGLQRPGDIGPACGDYSPQWLSSQALYFLFWRPSRSFI